MPVFLVRLRQAGPEFDPAKALTEQTGWDEHAAPPPTRSRRTQRRRCARSGRATRGTGLIWSSSPSSRGRSGSQPTSSIWN